LVHLGAEVLYHSAMGGGDPGATQAGPPIGSYAIVDGPRTQGPVEGERVSLIAAFTRRRQRVSIKLVNQTGYKVPPTESSLWS
jgi:hypothetical protein